MSLTLKWISRQAKLADNVSWDVGLDSLSLFGMTLSSLQEMIELFRIKLLQDKWHPSLKKVQNMQIEFNYTSCNEADWLLVSLFFSKTYQAFQESSWPGNHNEDLLYQLLDEGHLCTLRTLSRLRYNDRTHHKCPFKHASMRDNLKGDDPLLLSTADRWHRGKRIPNTAEKRRIKATKPLEGLFTSWKSRSSLSVSSQKYREVIRPRRDFSRQSLASSMIWWCAKLSTPSASGRTFSGELLWMISLMRSSIWAVAYGVERRHQGYGV